MSGRKCRASSTRMFSVLLVGLLVSTTWTPILGKGKPRPQPSVEVVIDDSPDAKVTSDGGSYMDGVDGVRAVINGGVTEDLLFDADMEARKRDIKNGLSRYINLDLDDPAPGTQGLIAHFSSGIFLNVDRVGEVSVPDGPVDRDAVFNTPLGSLKLQVEVVSTDSCTWEITSDSGNIAVLTAYDQQATELGQFFLPFQMTVTLASCL